MKKAFLYVTPVVGLPQVTGWAQVAENSHTFSHRFVCAFAVAGDTAGNIGRTITQAIAQFEPHSVPEAVAFIEEQLELCTAQQAQLYCSCLYTHGQQAAFIAYQGSVVLKRGSKVGQIVGVSPELQVLAGNSTLDDVVVLSTSQASGFLPEIEQKFKTGFYTDTIITSIVPGVHSQDDSSHSALAFIVRSEHEIEPEPEMPSFVLETELNVSDSDDSSSSTTQSEQSSDDAPAKSSAQSQTAVTDPESSIAEPFIVAETVESPGAQALAGLGITQQASSPPRSSSAGVKVVAGFMVPKVAWLWRLLRQFASWLVQRLRQVSLSSLKPQQLRSKLKQWRAPRLSVDTSNRKQFLIRTGAITIALAILVGLALFYRNRQAQELAATQASIAPLQQQIVSAQETVGSSPIESRQQVQATIQELEALKAAAEASGKPASAKQAIQEALEFARNTETAISGQIEVNTLQTFYDLRLISADFVTTAAHSQGSTAAFYDQQKQQLIILNLERKQVRALSVELAVKALRVQGEQLFLLADGVYSLDLTNEDASPEKIIEEGDSNREGSLLGAYEIYLYVFNADRRNVYRYADQGEEYSEPIGWMQATRGLDYRQVRDMAIDGDLWLTTEAGEIYQFTSGSAQDFTVVGIPNAFSSPIKIHTATDQERLYILETEKRRVVVLEKDGTFIKEVVSASLASVTDIFVSEQLGQIFAVSGSIVYSIPL